MASHAAASDPSRQRAATSARGQRTEQPQQVGHALGVAGLPVGRESLQLELELGQHVGVEQLPELGPAQQLGQQALVEREGRGTPLGDGRVAFVHERRDVAEQQRPRERRGLRGRDLDDPDLARGQVPHHPEQRRDVVHVLEALADGLQHDREGRVLDGDLEQLGAALTLLPQRRPPAGVAARQQQRSGRALAEAGREQRRAADLPGDDVLDLVGVEHDDVAAGRVLVGLGDAEHDAVVTGQRLGVDAVALAQPDADRQRPRCMHLGAVGRVDHDAPVTELVAEPLDQHRPVGRHRAGRLALLVEERDQVAGGPGVEARVGAALPGLVAGQGRQLAGERPDGGAELRRTAELVTLPERQPPWLAGRRGHEDPVVGDVLDPPRRRAEREDVTDPGLVDHLLVELADARGLLADQEHAEQPAVGDRAAAGDRETLRARPGGERARDAVPHDTRPQLAELVGGVAAAEQVERRVVRRAGQRREGGRAADRREQGVDVPLVDRGRGDDLLGEHVERVGRHVQRLDRTGAHPLHGDRGLHQVPPVLGQQDPAGHLADLVAGATDPLEGRGDRRRRLDLHDEVDRAHVDAELEAGRRHDAGQPAPLEVVLDQGPLLLGHRPVVGAGDDRVRGTALARLPHQRGRRPRGSAELLTARRARRRSR